MAALDKGKASLLNVKVVIFCPITKVSRVELEHQISSRANVVDVKV